jgi:hypothetical protein
MTQNTVPLPEPMYVEVMVDGTWSAKTVYTAYQMHAHAAKVCAEKDAEIERLRAALVIVSRSSVSYALADFARAALKETK